MKEFQKGQRIKTASGSELEVLEKLGEGGQVLPKYTKQYKTGSTNKFLLMAS